MRCAMVWLTVKDVSAQTRLGEERIRELIRQRKLRAAKLGRWLIRPEDLDRFIHSRTNMGEGAYER